MNVLHCIPDAVVGVAVSSECGLSLSIGGDVSVSLSVTEAVDLVDALTAALSGLQGDELLPAAPDGRPAPPGATGAGEAHTQTGPRQRDPGRENARPIRCDPAQALADATTREDL